MFFNQLTINGHRFSSIIHCRASLLPVPLVQCRSTAPRRSTARTTGFAIRLFLLFRQIANLPERNNLAESTSKCNTRQNYNKSLKNSSLGVEKFNFSLGLRFIFSWTEWMNSSLSSRKSVPLGIYCRISLFIFSILPFCHEA